MSSLLYITEIMKHINYQLEISETGKQDVVLASYSTATPFMPINVGEKINLIGLQNVTQDEYWNGKTLRVEQIKHGIWEDANTVTQKILVSGTLLPKYTPADGMEEDGSRKH